MKLQRTEFLNSEKAHANRKWLLVDADGVALGRLAADVAAILRGKHKPTYTPNTDCGDHVVIVNAAKVRLTAGKETKKLRYHHSFYPGGLNIQPYGKLLAKDPAAALRRAIRGMLPHNVLGREMLHKLKIHAGPEHPHQAQGVEAYTLPHLQGAKETGE
jgi:large subunit ribosomal protein L13